MKVIGDFVLSRIPKIIFGAGKIRHIPYVIEDLVKTPDNRKEKFTSVKTVLLVTGAKWFRSTEYWAVIQDALWERTIAHYSVSIEKEPSPDIIDSIVLQYKYKNIDVVAAIGGGSVIDAGKAISAMLLQEGSVMDYLEGVGKDIPHNGKKVPFIAIPTTAGTGSEATKNAVISRIGQDGFKKSLRHDNFVPETAIIDPELTLSCPPKITASCGLDAFTQLLEAYVSLKSNQITDTLSLSGIDHIKNNLLKVYTTESKNLQARSALCYASLLSGISLANAGLGIVHGLASSIGGYFDIPHGVICGTLIGSATKVITNKLKKLEENNIILQKYAHVGKILTDSRSPDKTHLCDQLVEFIDEWIFKLHIPKLGKFGVKESDLNKIVANATNKQNPIPLDDEDIKEILIERL